jgi:toxin ParE1/3/4
VKRLVRSERSDDDVREVVQHLLREASASAALRFLDALEESYLLLQSQPEIGRLYAPENSELRGIRSWRVHRFERYLVFYQLLEDAVRIARVLHGSRDIWTDLGFDD